MLKEPDSDCFLLIYLLEDKSKKSLIEACFADSIFFPARLSA